MPDSLTESASAKVNLYLHLTGRRADGYHLLDSLVVFADVGDELTAEPAPTLSLCVKGPFATALAGLTDNLVLRAARGLAASLEMMPQARLVLHKNLPVASGIGVVAQTAATMKQLMLDLIHPASNEILLIINRGGPADEKEWAAVRRSALALAESGDLLMARGRARAANDWPKDARLLADAGGAAYKAALGKDAKALAAAADSLDASCTACHKQFRPDVFPRQEGSK